MKLVASTVVLVLVFVVWGGGNVEAFTSPVVVGSSVKATATSQVHQQSPRMRSPNYTQGLLVGGTTTSLAMKGNLLDRFVRVFNANMNKLVSGLEDPEKVIVQAVDDMQVRVRIFFL